MKYIRNLLVLTCLIVFSTVGYCDSLSSQGKYGIKLNLQSPNAVSEQANKASAFGSTSQMDPFVQAEINGLGNMMQGMTGNSSNFYAVDEQIKQQAEYTRQQVQNAR